MCLWARNPNLVTELVSTRQNARYLPGVHFPDPISATHSLYDALAESEIVVVTVPSHGLRAVIRDARPAIDTGAVVVSAVKGLEVGSMRRMSEMDVALEPAYLVPRPASVPASRTRYPRI